LQANINASCLRLSARQTEPLSRVLNLTSPNHYVNLLRDQSAEIGAGAIKSKHACNFDGQLGSSCGHGNSQHRLDGEAIFLGRYSVGPAKGEGGIPPRSRDI